MADDLHALPAAVEPAEDPRPAIRSGLAIVGMALVLGGAWLALSPLAAAVVAPAFVKVDTNRKVVQHQEGGIVSEIRVRDGARVAEGQILLVLEDVRVDASLDLLRQQHDSERARQARLMAERELAQEIAFPAELAARSFESRTAEIVEREQSLFAARRGSLNTQVELLRQQMRQAKEEAAAFKQQADAERKALELMREEAAANEDLLKKNFVQKTRVLTLQRNVAEYEARLGEHEAERSRASQKATDLELRILAARNNYVQTATDELKDNTNKLFEIEERLRPSQDAARRQNIAAPVAGEVVDLRVTTAGSVIGPRDPLMEIVPLGGKLIVEARIRPEDIGGVVPGTAAAVRLTAFKSRLTPLIDGIVTYASADRLIDRANGAAYYVVHIEVPPEALHAAGDLRLQAGMPAEVFIKLRERTALDYLVEPITAYIRRAFREP